MTPKNNQFKYTEDFLFLIIKDFLLLTYKNESVQPKNSTLKK